jgi:hypothetical protein
MSKPHKRQKPKHTVVELKPELEQELEFILDRFRVQHPHGASLESYLQSLRGSLEGKEPLAVALLERIGKHPGEVGYRLLQTLRDRFPSKIFRKVYRQAEYRFRQAGYGAEPQAADGAAAILVPGEVKKSVAHMSPMSPDGHWFVSALVPDEQQARTLLFVLIAFPFQCVELRTMPSSFGDYREFQKELAHNFIHPYVEISLRQAARVVFDLLESGGATGAHHNQATIRRLLKPFHGPNQPAYCDELLPLAPSAGEDVTEGEVAALLQELPVNALTFPKEDLKPFWEKIQALEHSVLVVAREIKEERVKDIIAEAANQLCSGATRPALQRFFEEQAMYFRLLGQAQPALTLWKTVQHLRSSESASNSLVILKLISASFFLHWHEDFEEGQVGEGVPVEEDPTYRTDSGLILLK